MATVYKVEIEIVSDWINYPPEYVEKFIKDQIEDINPLLKQDFKIDEIKAERIA